MAKDVIDKVAIQLDEFSEKIDYFYLTLKSRRGESRDQRASSPLHCPPTLVGSAAATLLCTCLIYIVEDGISTDQQPQVRRSRLFTPKSKQCLKKISSFASSLSENKDSSGASRPLVVLYYSHWLQPSEKKWSKKEKLWSAHWNRARLGDQAPHSNSKLRCIISVVNSNIYKSNSSLLQALLKKASSKKCARRWERAEQRWEHACFVYDPLYRERAAAMPPRDAAYHMRGNKTFMACLQRERDSERAREIPIYTKSGLYNGARTIQVDPVFNHKLFLKINQTHDLQYFQSDKIESRENRFTSRLTPVLATVITTRSSASVVLVYGVAERAIVLLQSAADRIYASLLPQRDHRL
ncbi:unnamed protein product [Trichogramma brassicae]|uniref:Uncharacterized protein n=1 Tax=Trichogramma brassicae TaxID=86971 RepID=A0A6H5IQ21_9HYME|nr:unnamed protein product [Trichogramma brassicae]